MVSTRDGLNDRLQRSRPFICSRQGDSRGGAPLGPFLCSRQSFSRGEAPLGPFLCSRQSFSRGEAPLGPFLCSRQSSSRGGAPLGPFLCSGQGDSRGGAPLGLFPCCLSRAMRETHGRPEGAPPKVDMTAPGWRMPDTREPDAGGRDPTTPRRRATHLRAARPVAADAPMITRPCEQRSSRRPRHGS